MKRIAISIVFNGINHLKNQFKWSDKDGKHLGVYQNIDHWIFVQGASKSTFCTSWCKSIPEEYHSNGNSIDGTIPFLENLSKLYPNKITVINTAGFWDGKVSMFNEALKLVNEPCYLWEIDIDEYWTATQMSNAEKILDHLGADIGSFNCDYLLSDDIIVKGAWGEALGTGYRRLWKYKPHSRFIAHEPPVLENASKMVSPYLMPRFKHLSYYYEEDVIFKSKWYGNHHNIYNGWRDILSGVTKLPCEIKDLFRSTIPGDWNNTIITHK
jgi:hypothetical protein